MTINFAQNLSLSQHTQQNFVAFANHLLEYSYFCREVIGIKTENLRCQKNALNTDLTIAVDTRRLTPDIFGLEKNRFCSSKL